MHSDINALITHGPQFGIDADPIRATHAYRDQIERFFGERSADPANCVTRHGKAFGAPLPKRPRTEVDSNVGLSQPSQAPNIGNDFSHKLNPNFL